MSWRDNLRKAAFRGVPFFYEDSKSPAGRRTVVHGYPLQDEVWPEDLGRAPKKFTISGYVLGADYIAKRDALEEALDKPGPGTLVHPTRGEIQVACAEPAEIAESTREGGMARFTMHFIVGGDNKFPISTVDTMAQVDARADAAQLAAEDDFAAGFSLDGSPAFVGPSAGDLVTGAMDEIAAAAGGSAARHNNGAGRAGGIPAAIGAEMTEITSGIAPYAFAAQSALSAGQRLTSAVGQLRSGGLAMLVNRLPFARSIFSLGRLLSARGGSASEAYAAQTKLWTYGADLAPVRRTTAARATQADNQAAMTALVRRAALIEAARLSARMEFTSYDQAVATRNELGRALDAERQTAADPVFRTLTDLHGATARDITARGGTLARVTTVRAPSTLPAVVVAHRLFGDATRAADLMVWL